ncbi:MAG: isochorismate synthase [Streptosporangiales bacterium]|nr:isochorismate synthase [Streptosporangiales bacterium]
MSIALGLPPHLVVRSVPIDDPGELVFRLPEPAGLAWLRRGDGLIGLGEAARIRLGPDGVRTNRFVQAGNELRELFGAADVEDRVGVPGSGPVAFGSFTFDPRSAGSVLVVPRAVIGRRDGRAWLTTIGDGADPDALTQVRPAAEPVDVRWGDGTLAAPDWERAVERAVKTIRAGRLAKVVLSRDLYAWAEGPIDPRVLLRRLAGRFPDCYTFACDGLVGATPELLVRREDDRITSLVLAGSTSRSPDPVEDARRGEALLASAKDVEEHKLAVESVRAALEPLCADVRIAAEPSLLVLANVQHLASPVTGRLGDARTAALEVAAALHPTAAVCGTPTPAALEFIRKLEGMDRGRYAGPVGWIDAGGNGEWGIALRCAQIDGTQARLFAGGGIVAGSDPAAELAETQVKFSAMRYALEGHDHLAGVVSPFQ